jgi:hypothetical protein
LDVKDNHKPDKAQNTAVKKAAKPVQPKAKKELATVGAAS